MKEIFEQIKAERKRQDAKWGVQNLPSVCKILTDRVGGCSPVRMCEEYEIPTESRAKQLCDTATRRGELTHAHIVLEELSESVSCLNDADRRVELIQLAATIVKWIENIDRNNL